MGSLYQIQEILEGKIKEGLPQKVRSAPFDERISIVSLLFAKLNLQFKKIREKEEVLEILVRCLREWKQKDIDLKIEKVIKNLTLEWKQKKEAQLLTRTDEIKYKKAIEKAEEFSQMIKKENIIQIDMVWKRIQELFSEQTESYENEIRDIGNLLENAFNFMEAVFSDSQEMVIFITELNRSYFAIHFLQEYECERYYEYNKRLLFEEEEKIINKKLEKLQL